MTDTDYYEIVRQKLTFGPVSAPKHEKIYELMKIFWDEDTIKILSYFPSSGGTISSTELAEKSGIPKKEITKALRKAVKKRTIIKLGNKYELAPLIPGVFEAYYITRQDTDENLKKVAKIFRYMFEHADEFGGLGEKFTLFRPILPVEASEKLININKSLDTPQSQVLPYELVEEMINKNEYFAVIPCQCRLIAELNNEHCEFAPSEMGCFIVGASALATANMGLGRSLTKEEAIEYLKETEKAGLVHNASNDASEHSFICNCCPDHCGALLPFKKFGIKNIKPSNFIPKINQELCIKCKTCANKCPMEMILYSEPEDIMIINYDNCIGCGVCASNCQENAILMEKIRNDIPKKENKMGNKTFGEVLQDLLT
ncbi:MAG: 4Fe-4S binding protein [Candidatus Helarchaeota archaeon]